MLLARIANPVEDKDEVFKLESILLQVYLIAVEVFEFKLCELT